MRTMPFDHFGSIFYIFFIWKYHCQCVGWSWIQMWQKESLNRHFLLCIWVLGINYILQYQSTTYMYLSMYLMPNLNSGSQNTWALMLPYKKYVENWAKVVKWHRSNEAESSLNLRTHIFKLFWALKFWILLKMKASIVSYSWQLPNIQFL